MKKKQKIITAMIAIGMAASLSGCQRSMDKNQNSDSSYYMVDIDGNRIGISAEDERVTVLNETTKEFLTAAVSKNYKNPDVMKEYDYYTSDVCKAYLDAGRPDSSLNSMKLNELVVEVNTIELETIQFYNVKGETAAKVIGNYISTINHSTDTYITQVALKHNTQYRRSINVEFILEDGVWKVSDYSMGSREEVK